MRDIDQLLVRTQSEVRSYIAALGVPLCDVDDLAQDVYLAFATAADGPPAGVEAVRWLKGIARNTANAFFRKRERRGEALARLAQVLDSARPGDEAAFGQEPLGALRRCLGRLDGEHRDLVRRYYGDDEGA